MTSPPLKSVFFIDWCLGKTVARVLAEAGAKVEHHEDHFESGTPDSDWLQVVGQRGWVVLTKDAAIGRNPLEQRALTLGGVKAFILVSGNLTRQSMAELFVTVLPRLELLVRDYQAPFIAKIYKSGKVEMWKKQDELQARFQ